ncbi:hypothetical protein C6Q14_18725 [Burkholderia ambifaria]|nr:hypothetical protein C6Q14_18725 [Burkholderia ambifaria]
MPIVEMYQDLPFRLLREDVAETAAEFVRINFRGTGEHLRVGVLARARARTMNSALLGATEYASRVATPR